MEQKDPNAKEGMRVRMVSMYDDPNPIEPGTMGTIRLVDDMGTIHVNWDNGRTLGLIPGIDHYQLMPDTNTDLYDETNKMFESTSSSSAIKSAISKTPSNISKSMPKSTKISSSTNSSLKSSGIKTGQVSKNFKSANIKDIKVEQEDQIKGGKADKLSIKDLAKKHNVSIDEIKKEIKIGVKIEKEHVGNDVSKAKEIAMDHIAEFSDYYSNKRYGVLASEKGLKKDEKKREKKIKTETTAAAGGASTGAYTGNAWGAGPLTKNNKVAKPGPVKENKILNKEDINRLIGEATATFYTHINGSEIYKKYDDTKYESWAEDNDGWRWNDNPIFTDGEIVDPLAHIKTAWDDENLDISDDWDQYQNKKLKKEDLLRMVEKRLNESEYEIVNDKKLDSVKDNFKPPIEEEELDETTTFSSVWGVNGPPVGPAFAAKKGQWKMIKKPIWKGGTIVQKDFNEGVLNPINEVNKVKYNPKGKYVKIAKKCTKFPYCNQGAIDNPLKLSNNVSEPGTYVEGLDNETIKNIHEISKETGKPFIEIYRIVKKQMEL